MSEQLSRFITQRLRYLEDKKSLWEEVWQEVADFIIPIRENIRGDQISGFKMANRIYDGTAVYACKLMTDGIHGNHVSPAIQWFKLAMEDKELDSNYDVRVWTQDVEEVKYKIFNRSSFYDNVWMFLYDGGSIGTAVMYIEYNYETGSIIYETVHPGEVYIEDNVFGEVTTLFRKRNLTAMQALERFGMDRLPQATKDLLKDNPYKEETWVHAVYPRENWDSGSMLNTKKRFASVWMHKGSGNICQVSGYNMFPYAVWRFYKSGKEVYGRSPGMYALQDVKGCNLMGKTLLGAAQMSIDPPLNIPTELMGQVQWMPRGHNHYTSRDRTVFPANTNINYPVGRESVEAKQEMINKHFFVQMFLMLNNSERQMTATEVLEKQGEKAVILGAAISRLNRESLDKVIDLTFSILLEQGKLPPIPEIVLERGEQNIQIEYLGPLSQAQKRLFATQGIKAGIEVAAPAFQLFPETMDKINADKTVERLLTGYGFPQDCLYSDDEVAETRRDRAKRKQDELMMQNMELGSQSIRNLADANKKSQSTVVDMLNQNMEKIPA